MSRWAENWEKGSIGFFHQTQVHPMLVKNFSSLIPDGKANKVFIPLCGKTLDMKWLADKGIHVVGLDIVPLAFEQFFSEQCLEVTKETVSGLKEGDTLYKSADDKIHLYCCDIFDFNESIEGTFDAIWDRASIVALERSDVPRYVAIIKKLLKPGGRCMMETMQYNLADFDNLEEGSYRPPPPHAMDKEEVKKLYEPECSFEFLNRHEIEISGQKVTTLIMIVTKLS